MEKTENTQLPTSLVSDASLSTFIEVFYRIFKIGVYYPVGHVVVDQAAEKFVVSLRDTFPARRTVSLEFKTDGLFVEKRVVAEKNASVKGLHQLMTRLGIYRIVFDRIVSSQQFLDFVRSLLKWRAELDGTKSFRAFNIADLPATIRVAQERYLVDGNGLSSDESGREYDQKLEKMYEALTAKGLSEEQVNGCRELMDNLASYAMNQKIDVDGLPHATWDDVQSLLVKSVTRACNIDGSEDSAVVLNDINALSSIFVSFETGLTDKKSKETVSFLLSQLVVGNKSEENELYEDTSLLKKHTVAVSGDNFDATVADIKKFVKKNTVPLKVLKEMACTDRSQELTIILQLLHTSDNELVVEKCRSIVKTILLSDVTPQEWEVFFAGMQHTAEFAGPDKFKDILDMVIRTLRDGRGVNSKVFLVILWKKMPMRMHILLWPFVVNELLYVGLQKDLDTFNELTKIVCQLPVETMKQLYHQLERTVVFKEKKVATVIFRPSFVYSYHFFSFLLETPLAEIIGSKILQSLVSAPQDDFFMAVGPVLRISDPAHMEFLRLYLTQFPFDEVPLILSMTAGKIILEFLENISDAEREAPWLPKTIEATSSLQVDGMKEMLERIVEERKMRVMHVWSKNCRRAADSALKYLNRNKLSHLL